MPGGETFPNPNIHLPEVELDRAGLARAVNEAVKRQVVIFEERDRRNRGGAPIPQMEEIVKGNEAIIHAFSRVLNMALPIEGAQHGWWGFIVEAAHEVHDASER